MLSWTTINLNGKTKILNFDVYRPVQAVHTGPKRCFDPVSGDTRSVPGGNDWNPIVIEAYQLVHPKFRSLSRYTGRYASNFDHYQGVPVSTPW